MSLKILFFCENAIFLLLVLKNVFASLLSSKRKTRLQFISKKNTSKFTQHRVYLLKSLLKKESSKQHEHFTNTSSRCFFNILNQLIKMQ